MLQKEVLAYLEGYRRADEFIEEERRRRLAKMTPEESKAIFSALMERWAPITEPESEQFRAWRLRHKIEMRKVFLLHAKANGYL